MRVSDSIPGRRFEQRVAKPNSSDENYADPVRWGRERNLESTAEGTDSKCNNDSEDFFHVLGREECGRQFRFRKVTIY